MVAGRRFVRSVRSALLRLAPLAGLAACGDEPTSATAPFAIEASLSGEPDAEVGVIVTPAPAFVVRNSQGLPLANVPVAITITKGDGTLRNAPLRTASGPTPIGEWTLDTIARVNEVRIVAGDAPPVTISVAGIAGPPASVSTAGSLDGLAGDFLNNQFTLRVRDRYGNPVSGAGIGLVVGKGGGEVSPTSLTTDDNGVASGITWRLGRFGGSQQLVATVGNLRAEIAATIRSGFDPVVRAVGTALPPALAGALTTAAERIHATIVGDASDVPVLNFDLSRCGLQGGATLNETVDDIVIFAMVTPIDGVGRVLASAGPCVLRTQSRFPVIGIMRFDSDDIGDLSANGRLPAVVLHEMLHVIGIGSLWRTRDMLVGTNTTDPRFTGLLAGAQCVSSGGLSDCSDGRVPVENTGGSGTAEVHWRESVFDREVMTGFVESNADMPFSTISIASLEDLGYLVNLLSADPYLVIPPPPTVSPRLSPSLLPRWEILEMPVLEITPLGWVRPYLTK